MLLKVLLIGPIAKQSLWVPLEGDGAFNNQMHIFHQFEKTYSFIRLSQGIVPTCESGDVLHLQCTFEKVPCSVVHYYYVSALSEERENIWLLLLLKGFGSLGC